MFAECDLHAIARRKAHIGLAAGGGEDVGAGRVSGGGLVRRIVRRVGLGN